VKLTISGKTAWQEKHKNCNSLKVPIPGISLVGFGTWSEFIFIFLSFLLSTYRCVAQVT
jgi:hypothetical protein